VARIVIISFRLGGTDGVSIEAEKWAAALQSLGHEVIQVAGEGAVNILIPGLAIHAQIPPSLGELERAFERSQLVIVENMASLPLNVGARDVLYGALDGRTALFHHHDLAWQREHLAHLEGPRDQATWRHVTINDLSRSELALRAISATTIRNSFDCDPPPGDREGTRQRLHISGQALLLMPTRAIARKNVAGALRLASELEAVLWLLGPSEDGYEEQLQELLTHSGVEVRQGLADGMSVHDAYAACDLVVMASTWEGFGNPVLESVTHRRALAVYPYRVLEEITSFGFEFFGLDDVGDIREFLRHPDESRVERNLAIARAHFNLIDLPGRLAQLLELDESDVRESLDTTRGR
jgi:glycosyltransferase involved in cell wall biosynthesis